jgi:hypothetical protein
LTIRFTREKVGRTIERAEQEDTKKLERFEKLKKIQFFELVKTIRNDCSAVGASWVYIALKKAR